MILLFCFGLLLPTVIMKFDSGCLRCKERRIPSRRDFWLKKRELRLRTEKGLGSKNRLKETKKVCPGFGALIPGC